MRIRAVSRSGFTPELLRRLHALANGLMAEELEHFCVHAESNDVVHLFEEDGELVGFQFWRTASMGRPGWRAILGGKLRVLPAHRRRALHLRSGLRFYVESQLRHPLTRFYRLSLASLFGFVSITSALAEYRLFDPRAAGAEGRAIRETFQRLAAENHYRLDLETGLFFVNIFPSAATLAGYPDGYYARPEAQVYIRANPGFRENGCNIAFWFRFTPRNLAALLGAIARKTRRAGSATLGA